MKKRLVRKAENLSIRSREFNIADDVAVDLVQDICDTLTEHEELLFLTASQIGYKERAFGIRFKDAVEVFMNPAIQEKDVAILYRERDYSNGKEYIIPRFTKITLVFQDVAGKTRAMKFNESASIIVNQAMDMLDGVFPSDYGLEIIPEFDTAPEEEKAEVLAAYVDSLASTFTVLDKELMEDSETKSTWEQAKFYRGLADGEIKTEEKPLSNRKKKRLKKFLKMFGKKVK